jgi:hypothetical protein
MDRLADSSRLVFLALIIAVSTPGTLSHAKFLNWLPVADPTFAGTIYQLKCTSQLRASIVSNGLAEPLTPWNLNPFLLNIEERTLTFLSPATYASPIPVDIKASHLENTFSKMLRVTWREKNILSGVVIDIEGGGDGKFSASYALTSPSDGAEGKEMNFGQCQGSR